MAEVYVVSEVWDYDGSAVEAVFDSLEKAMNNNGEGWKRFNPFEKSDSNRWVAESNLGMDTRLYIQKFEVQ